MSRISAAQARREAAAAERARCADVLRNYGLAPGSTLTTIRTGRDQWRVLCIARGPDVGEFIADITAYVAGLAGWRWSEKTGLLSGPDSGFRIIFGLGRAMWPNGVERPANCNPNAAEMDGGYALRHRAL